MIMTHPDERIVRGQRVQRPRDLSVRLLFAIFGGALRMVPRLRAWRCKSVLRRPRRRT
jgi:hypothetical protein